MRTLTLLALAATLLTGCSIGSSGASGISRGSATGALAHFRGAGVSFSYPAAWGHHRPGFQSPESSGIVDLSTQPMGNPCQTHGNVTFCDMPIRHLRQGGVVVRWTIDGMPTTRRPRAGIHIKVTRPGYCRNIGGDETIAATLITPKHERLQVDACLRSPGVAAKARAVRAMLASTRPR